MTLYNVALCLTLSCVMPLDNIQALSLMKDHDQTTLPYEAGQSVDSRETLLLSDRHKRSAENKPQSDDSGSQPVAKVPCSDKEKLFSSKGLIIVACLSCLSFLLLYMVILMLTVPRLCFPYHPDSKKMKERKASMKETKKVKSDELPQKINPSSRKTNNSGRNDSGIESVDGLVTGCHDTVTGSEISPFIDRLYDFDKAVNRSTFDDELVGEERRPPNRLGMSTFNGKRPRSQSVAMMPSRYQTGIYIEL